MVTANWEEVRALMWNYVGIVRSDKRLARARRRLDVLHQEIREYYWHYRVTRDVLELRSIALVGSLIVESAMRRKESRGLHYTLDYPDIDPAQAVETIFTRQDGP
jgi:L-aspartate oxidase